MLRKPRGASKSAPLTLMAMLPDGVPRPGCRIDPDASSEPPFSAPVNCSTVIWPFENRTVPWMSAKSSRGSRIRSSALSSVTKPSMFGVASGPLIAADRFALPEGRELPSTSARLRRSNCPSIFPSTDGVPVTVMDPASVTRATELVARERPRIQRGHAVAQHEMTGRLLRDADLA